jgi:hypothetical protein
MDGEIGASGTIAASITQQVDNDDAVTLWKERHEL